MLMVRTLVVDLVEVNGHFFYLGVTFIYNLNSNVKHLNALATA